MFSYYGSKSKLVNLYPMPKFGKVIEPFAGSARYALKYFDRDILLVDKYDVIVRVWQWLQKCSEKDIMSLPILQPGQSVDEYKWDCDEARWLVGFNIATAPQQPKKTATYWKSVLRPNTQNYKRKLIAKNLFKIRHWEIRQGSFDEIPNDEATWFIDPPYQVGGEYYKHTGLNYQELATWCKSRNGQAIVCENTKADWLPFLPMQEITGNAGDKSVEALWSNYSHEFESVQLSLFTPPNTASTGQWDSPVAGNYPG